MSRKKVETKKKNGKKKEKKIIFNRTRSVTKQYYQYHNQ